MVCKNGEQYETVCNINRCNGCTACETKCPVGAIRIEQELFFINAIVNTKKCIHCGACKRVCPQIVKPVRNSPLDWKRGWANNSYVRERASSGGIVSSLIELFVKHGDYVCTCIFKDGKFTFVLTDNIEDLKKASGSKYVKSDVANIYKDVELKLQEGNKVLFIGLPCQVAGLINYIGEKNKNNLYTVDMLCHGTPSAELLQMFIDEQSLTMNDVREFSFREKNSISIYKNNKSFAVKGTLDYYSMAFICGISYTENCYQCEYASEKRISDITVGDSWIEDNYKDELKKGISLVLIMSEKGRELLTSADISLIQGSKDDEIKSKPELSHPTLPLGDKDKFRKNIRNGKSISWAVCNTLTFLVIKQKIKGLLLRTGLIKLDKGVTYSISVKM